VRDIFRQPPEVKMLAFLWATQTRRGQSVGNFDTRCAIFHSDTNARMEASPHLTEVAGSAAADYSHRMVKKSTAKKPGHPTDNESPRPLPGGKSSALLDTRVVYRGDNLEQPAKLPDACVDLIFPGALIRRSIPKATTKSFGARRKRNAPLRIVTPPRRRTLTSYTMRCLAVVNALSCSSW